jgi:hypothetical protein
MIPESYIQRVIQFARQGYSEIDFRTYDTDWESEAYLTVAGQNSNNSVRISNEFLDRVRNDGDWELTRRTDGKIVKRLPARALWDKIGHAAWAPDCSSIRRSTNGTPALSAAGSTHQTPAPNIISSTIRPATSPP